MMWDMKAGRIIIGPPDVKANLFDPVSRDTIITFSDNPLAHICVSLQWLQ